MAPAPGAGMRGALRLTSLLAAIALGAPAAARAQQVHVLIVNGLAGEPRFRARFEQAAAMLADTARLRWGVADSSLVVLAGDSVGPSRQARRSTRDEIAQSFARLSRRVAPGDLLLVFLNGHGSGEGLGSRVSLPGPDATAADFAGWLAGFARQTVVFVNAASGSGDFVGALARPGRLIVTATRTALERNETTFGAPFVRGLTGSEADADKDGRVSVLEAFAYAKREVERAYEADNRMLTEHAVLSDTTLARTVAFGGARASSDPRIVALVAERQALESEVAALRARKGSLDPVSYDRELERLLVTIAEKSQAIRAARGRP
jgi:hypothetical protein